MENDKLIEFIEEMVYTYNSELFKVAIRRMGNKEDAEDILNELWYMVSLKANVLINHPNKIAWLYTGLKLCIQRHHAKQTTRVRKLTNDGQRITENRRWITVPMGVFYDHKLVQHQEFFKNDNFDEFKDILTELEMKYVLSKFRDDFDNEEIAHKEGKSYSAITSLGYRVRRKLKKYLTETL